MDIGQKALNGVNGGNTGISGKDKNQNQGHDKGGQDKEGGGGGSEHRTGESNRGRDHRNNNNNHGTRNKGQDKG